MNETVRNGTAFFRCLLHDFAVLHFSSRFCSPPRPRAVPSRAARPPSQHFSPSTDDSTLVMLLGKFGFLLTGGASASVHNLNIYNVMEWLASHRNRFSRAIVELIFTRTKMCILFHWPHQSVYSSQLNGNRSFAISRR